MKRNWELDELIESWTLLPHELALLDSKIGANRLGFAVLLKFFELAHKFPSSPQDVPWEVVSYIAQPVNVPAQEYVNYDWNGRSMMRHRGEIRRWLGIRTCSSDDVQEMVDWLTNQVLGQELEIEHLIVAVEERFLLLKIEPPTRGRTERLIRSAIRTYESNFLALIHQKLSSQSRAAIDTLLETSDSEDEANSNFSVFYYLNSEPGRATLDSQLSLSPFSAKITYLSRVSLQ
ncbi:MAG: DUF4158 domain-containing protein [Cyanobacteria bacterium P01_G01_bin.67]